MGDEEETQWLIMIVTHFSNNQLKFQENYMLSRIKHDMYSRTTRFKEKYSARLCKLIVEKEVWALRRI